MNTRITSVSSGSILDSCVSVLKKSNDFTGRARRREYWQYYLVCLLASQVLNIIALYVFSGSGLMMGLVSLLNLALMIPAIALSVRRMHDVGKSGWFALIPIVNLILACTEGNKGFNEYGPDPKQSRLAETNA